MVESTQTSNRRKEIKQNLLNLADDLISQWEKLKVVIDDKELEYEARQTWLNGPVTVVKYNAKGYTKEHWAQWVADPVGIQAKTNDVVTPTRLEDDEGHPMWHLHFKMPAIISNRSAVICLYDED